MELFFIVLILFLISVIDALIFYLLVKPLRKISLREAFKLISVARALNKLLLTGSGFFASSYFAQDKNLTFSQSLGVFFLLEFLYVALWLPLGIYFGAKLALKIPWFFIVTILMLLAPIAWSKKKKLILAIRNSLGYFRKIGKRILSVMPLVILQISLVILYYFFLFKFFNFHPDFLNITKIVSISFTLGYLSPAPTGLGFKEGGFVALLLTSGVSLSNALSIAIFDRVFTTIFWGILGALTGFPLIRKSLKERPKKPKGKKLS